MRKPHQLGYDGINPLSVDAAIAAPGEMLKWQRQAWQRHTVGSRPRRDKSSHVIGPQILSCLRRGLVGGWVQ